MTTKTTQVDNKKLVYWAEVFFKMAYGIHNSDPKRKPFKWPEVFSWGKHVVYEKDLQLTKDEEDLAIAILHHVAVHTLATQIDTFLAATFSDRFNHANQDIQNIAWVARLIRNAFAHNPLYPKWQIYSECKNRVFGIRGIISLDTTALDGLPVDRIHYGGPLALLKLAEFVQRLET